MATEKELGLMARSLPPDYTALDKIVQLGPRKGVNLAGVVSDVMQPMQTAGKDLVMTVTLLDPVNYGSNFTVKFFSPAEEMKFPAVQDVGDVLLLRSITIMYRKEALVALSGYATEFIVFHRENIPSVAERLSYADEDSLIPHSKSSGAPDLTVHEQQWVISLSDRYPSGHGTGVRTQSQPPMRRASASTSMSTTAQSATPPKPVAWSTRDKFSLIKDIVVNKFYDIGGEAVKVFPSEYGYLDLYLTDYTSNPLLRDYSIPSYTSAWEWKGPVGRTTLKVELHPPHAQWVNSNVQVGNFILLKNVRIKESQGGEIEGNLWMDQRNPDRICVEKYNTAHPQYAPFVDRRSAFKEADRREGKKETKAERRSRKKEEHLKRIAEAAGKTKQAGKQTKTDLHPISSTTEPGVQRIPNEANFSSAVKDFEYDSEHETRKEEIEHAFKKRKLNPRIHCVHDNAQLSTFSEVIDNPRRKGTLLSTRSDFSLPFVNILHRVQLRVIDYYPHDLRKFARAYPDPHRGGQKWNWEFWLVVESGFSNDADDRAINLCVGGLAAADLLDADAQDLTNAERSVRQLKQRLWTLWGDLAEQKEKFLTAHPQLIADESFSARKYQIKANNLPFEAIVAEYGLPVLRTGAEDNQATLDSEPVEWQRIWKLRDTRIR